MKKIKELIIEALMPTAIKDFIIRLIYTPSYLFNKHEGINAFKKSASHSNVLAAATLLLLKDNHGVVIGELIVIKVEGVVYFLSLNSIKINESLNYPDEKIENGTIVYINDVGELDIPPTDN